jgi:hypothetical protein
MKKNEHAAAMGRMGKGKKKTMSESALAARHKGGAAMAAKATNPSRSTIWRRKKKAEENQPTKRKQP